jgi:DNA-binding FadR family transcriptional regulator
LSLASLAPAQRVSTVQHIAEQLRARVLSGSLEPGTKLPPERELAEQLQVNRLTLRAALSQLEAHGLISTQHGVGTVVCNFRETAGIESLPGLLSVARTHNPDAYLAHVRDLLELRRAIATEAVALAAERHKSEDLQRLNAQIERQHALTGDPLKFAIGDVEFARLIVRASRNLALELLINTVARFPTEDPQLTLAMYPNPPQQFKMYAPLVAMIATRTADVARERLRDTLVALDTHTLSLLREQLLKSGELSPRTTKKKKARK